MANVNFATGGTGPYRSQIGWFNFGARGIPYNSTINITNTFLNIGNISLGLFGATNNAVSLSTSGASGVLFATGYTGVTGNPSILFNQSGTQDTGQVNITNISFTDFNGRPLKFYLVSGDAETTIVQNEYIRWVTNGTAWYNAATIPLNGASAPYNSVFSGFGTNTFTNTQVGGSGSATPISPVLLSKNPTQIQLSAIPQAGEAGGFGFIYEGLGATKSVSANYSTPGSILTYTIPVTAYGIATISNITLIDTLPTGITFNPGSLAINGVTISNQSFPSITLPDLPVGSTATISFRVTVNQNPVPNPIINSAFVQGIAGATQGLSSTTPVSMMTNSVVTTIVSANLSAVKSVTPSLASVGTTLTYTITLSNSGNTTALNVLFLDTISNSTALIPGTFKQDNTTISSSPNPPGVTLPNGIAGNSTSTVTFQVLVTTFPSGNIIPNNATASYSYAVTSLNFISSATVSNTVDVLVSIVDLQGIKSVDKSFAKIGDILTYVMTIPNSGNVTASSVVLKDTIPNGTTFIPNSVYVNGVNKPGDVVYPPTGVTIPDIGPNGLDTVSFQVIVTTIPNPNPTPNSANIGYIYVVNPSTGATNSGSINTNTVSTQINTAIISNPVKLVNKSYIDIGDTLTYTILLRNTGNVTANNVLFIDTIPNGTVLVPNSFKQDNTPIPSSPNPPGTTLPNSIAPSTTSTITFSVVAVSIPNPNPIPNSATNSFDYVVNPSVVPSINGYGNASTNVFFKDTIPNGTTMVKDSLFVNNIQIYGTNPGNGVTIPNIPGYSSSVIVFKVKVDC